MKTIGAIFIIIELVLFSKFFQQSHGELTLDLYYEALCPGSREFIDDHLAPAYENISSLINVTFNPYGNTQRTKVDGHWVFDCQHGIPECELGILTACSIPKLNQSSQVKLVHCLSSLSVAEKCITDVQLNYTDILSCANGDLGEELFAKYGEETDALNPKRKSVPHLVFNGVYSKKLQDKARENLVETVISLDEIDTQQRISL